jgi:hypothetical protein
MSESLTLRTSAKFEMENPEPEMEMSSASAIWTNTDFNYPS